MDIITNLMTESNSETTKQTAETKAVDTDLSSFNGGVFPKTISELDEWPEEKEQILVG